MMKSLSVMSALMLAAWTPAFSASPPAAPSGLLRRLQHPPPHRARVLKPLITSDPGLNIRVPFTSDPAVLGKDLQEIGRLDANNLLPRKEVLNALGQYYVYTLTLKMRPGAQHVAVAVRDELAATAAVHP